MHIYHKLNVLEICLEPKCLHKYIENKSTMKNNSYYVRIATDSFTNASNTLINLPVL